MTDISTVSERLNLNLPDRKGTNCDLVEQTPYMERSVVNKKALLLSVSERRALINIDKKSVIHVTRAIELI